VNLFTSGRHQAKERFVLPEAGIPPQQNGNILEGQEWKQQQINRKFVFGQAEERLKTDSGQSRQQSAKQKTGDKVAKLYR
jgi:hypothetical protein